MALSTFAWTLAGAHNVSAMCLATSCGIAHIGADGHMYQQHHSADPQQENSDVTP